MKKLFSLAMENKYNSIQPAVKHQRKFQRPKKLRVAPNLCANAVSAQIYLLIHGEQSEHFK